MRLPNLAILIPYSRGFEIFFRDREGNLERVVDSNCPQVILRTISQLPPPRLAVHVGRSYDHFLAGLVFHQTDLCIIPEPWIRHIPLFRVRDRADFAMGLIEALLMEPICLFGAKNGALK